LTKLVESVIYDDTNQYRLVSSHKTSQKNMNQS